MKNFLKLVGIVFITAIVYGTFTNYDGSDEDRPADFKSTTTTKPVGGINKFLNRVKEKTEESKAERRADPNNQFESLEECLASDKEYDLNMGRAEYCESDYVLLKN